LRVAQDISRDVHYYANPDLPKTKSELTLPLNASGQVIGALDIQSQELDAFSEGDVLILQIIADQLAVAIENARLLRRQMSLADLRSNVIGLFNKISQQTSYDELLEVIPNSIRDTFRLSRVTLGLVEGGEVVVRSVSSSDDAVMPSPIDTAPIGEGVLGRTVAMKSPQTLTKQPIHELETQDPRTSGSQTILAIPLIIRDEVTGTLALETGIRDDLTKDEIESLELVAAQVAISLENSLLLEEMQQNLEQIDSLYRQQTSKAWTQLLSHQDVDGTTIIEDGAPPSGVISEPTFTTPIELRGQTIGRLNLQGIQSSDWSTEDQEILEAVADELAGALEQARLIEEVNRKVTQLQTAAEIARSASGFLELDALLSRAVNLVYERFGFHHIAIYLTNEDRLSTSLKEAAGEASVQLKDQQFQLSVGSKSIVGRVTELGEYYVANQVESDPFYWANPLLPEAKSELGIPLKISDDVIGALNVIHNRPFAFSEDDISVLQILADQVAVAVQNVQLFEETLQRAQREKSVVDITSQFRAERDVDMMLQNALLETTNALGAQTARIQLFQQIPDSEEDGTLQKDTRNLNDEEDNRTKFDNYESD
jgi:GAF domain-containing protein